MRVTARWVRMLERLRRVATYTYAIMVWRR